ncbi:MAG: hypothetical protein Q7T62_08275 [Undibacterium sp.]|nr:hypothetical protein [Undibacterium sp.]
MGQPVLVAPFFIRYKNNTFLENCISLLCSNGSEAGSASSGAEGLIKLKHGVERVNFYRLSVMKEI